VTRAPLSTLAWAALPLAAAIAASVCGSDGSPVGTAPSGSVPATTTTTTTLPPLSRTCERLGRGDPAAACGEERQGTFQGDLEWAIDAIYDEHPEYFDGFQVHNVGGYYVGVIRILDRIGICAYSTDGEELGVKNSAEFSEQYDILSARATVRRNGYKGICLPASFPLDDPPLTPPPPGCTLPPSRWTACGEHPVQYREDVLAAINQVLEQHPELFDLSDVSAGNRWPSITNMTAYENSVISTLTAKGYCVKNDGEQIAIKKDTNEFSENYDINFQDKYIRLGDGIFQSACYLAAF
jgi:hypothetical protein